MFWLTLVQINCRLKRCKLPNDQELIKRNLLARKEINKLEKSKAVTKHAIHAVNVLCFDVGVVSKEEWLDQLQEYTQHVTS